MVFLWSLRLLLIRPPHRIRGCLYVLVPPRSWGALKLLANRKSLAIGMMADFSVQRACTRKFHMTLDRHDDGFQHPACLRWIYFKFSHDDDWVVSKKCCIIWGCFLPDANNALQFRLISVGISFIFFRFDAASWPPDTLLPLASFSFLLFWYSVIKQASIFCLPAWGGAIRKKIKEVYRGGQANKKRRPVWTSPVKPAELKKPAELLPKTSWKNRVVMVNIEFSQN